MFGVSMNLTSYAERSGLKSSYTMYKTFLGCTVAAVAVARRAIMRRAAVPIEAVRKQEKAEHDEDLEDRAHCMGIDFL